MALGPCENARFAMSMGGGKFGASVRRDKTIRKRKRSSPNPTGQGKRERVKDGAQDKVGKGRG